LESHSASTTKQDIDEHRKKLEDIVNPIVAKLYGGAPGGAGARGEGASEDDEGHRFNEHDEL
jgi:heat shock protein 5